MADLSKVKIIKLVPGSKYQRLFNKDSGTSGIKAGHVILKPGEEIGEHSTNEFEEALVILNGSGRVNIDKKDTAEIEKDMVLYIPPYTLHDVKNTGQGALEYVFITSYAEKKE
ncbi:MAG: cupin domain-containing protein [Candidatus Omnitrophota bacterium]|jgi:mannose-6-phosphate isomerase-like protein (cupin superfamily)